MRSYAEHLQVFAT